MITILKTLGFFDNFIGGIICNVEPTNETEYQELITNTENRVNPNQELWSGTPKTWQEVLDKKSELEAEETSKEDAKVSGNQKLLDLGLTQAEATALTGYTPPVAE
jgi:hypothetical protein